MSKVITYTRRPEVCIMKRDRYGSVSYADDWETDHFLRGVKSPYDLDTKVPVEGHYTGRKVGRVGGPDIDELRYSGVVFGWLRDRITVNVDGKDVKEFYWDRLEEEDLSEWEDRFPYSLTQWDNRDICQSFLEDGEVSVILED